MTTRNQPKPRPAKDRAPFPASASNTPNQRGGRIEITDSLDLIDQASQESFPASDAPGWTFCDRPPCPGPETR